LQFLSTAQLKNAMVAIPRGAADYPAEWLDVKDAPETLYAVGDISLLHGRKFVIVGSRRTPAYALKLGAQIASDLSDTFVITTGTADGGDSAAIEGALRSGGRVICLLAGGFSSMPQGNLSLLQRVAENGLLLSPHEFDATVRAFSYEYRNKLLAKLGVGVLVLGAAQKSGALITAKHAKAFDIPVFALPYAPGSSAGEGCNALLKEGAYLTENATDVLKKYGVERTQTKTAVVLSADEEKLYVALKDKAEAHVSELSSVSGVPAFKARALLSALEVKGLVVALGGNCYKAL